MLGKWAGKEKRYGENFNAIMFRRSTVSSEDAIERSKDIYGRLGGTFNESSKKWRMPNGGRVSFAYLDRMSDANEYQGRNVSDAWVEEVGQYPDPGPIDRLFGVLRSAHGVPVQLVLTGNPGGSGQHWIKSRYRLAPFPRRSIVITRKLPTGARHNVAVIPSRIQDNRILLEADPGYIDRLHMVGSDALVRAWLEGDWSAVEGAFFDCWSQKNVVAPFAVPDRWIRFRSADWGSFSPFSIGWWAVVQDDYRHQGATLPRGALVRYREWYGSIDPANGSKGLKWTAEQVAEGIISRERGDPRLSYGVLDPSAFAQDGGPSIAERMNRRLNDARMPAFREADNKRVSMRDGKMKRGPMGGWDAMRQRIEGENGRPMAYWFSTCVASIRTIPVLQHDPVRAEDLDTTAEDHAADDARYACMSRPWVRSIDKDEFEKRDAYQEASDVIGDEGIKLL